MEKSVNSGFPGFWGNPTHKPTYTPPTEEEIQASIDAERKLDKETLIEQMRKMDKSDLVHTCAMVALPWQLKRERWYRLRVTGGVCASRNSESDLAKCDERLVAEGYILL